MASSLEANWNAVRKTLREACDRAERNPSDVELVAVTKHVACETAAGLARLGQRALGENRVDELERKATYFRENDLEACWHFIGHLQRNKARRAVRLADVIHSIDTSKLLASVDSHAAELGRRPGLYLEVKLTEDADKHGFAPSELRDAVTRAASLEHVELLGLMAMGPRMADAEPTAKRAAARRTFDRLAELARELEEGAETRGVFANGRVRLSMGMSSDVEEAIAAGTDAVRIGSALYEGLEPGANR